MHRFAIALYLSALGRLVSIDIVLTLTILPRDTTTKLVITLVQTVIEILAMIVSCMSRRPIAVYR